MKFSEKTNHGLTLKNGHNQKLDSIIAELKELLAPAQSLANNNFDKPKSPVLVVIGCSRSGTTLTTQILAQTGAFSYPSNFINRFAYAPYIGSLIQKMLLDSEYDFNGELSDLNSDLRFKSELGKTTGALSINEFFHFWRRFFPNNNPRFLDDWELSTIRVAPLRKELASIESAFGKPFMAKGKMMQYNIEFFAREMPELFFLHIKREPMFVMQSLIEARLKFHGTENSWYGNKPPEYALLKDRPVDEQVAGQVFFTVNSIQKAAKNIDPNRYLVVDYENVCHDPINFLNGLADRLKMSEIAAISNIHDLNIIPSNRPRLEETRLEKLEESYRKVSQAR